MDQIANMMNTIKNASRAKHESVVITFSKLKLAIAECLVKEGYLSSINKKTKNGFPILELILTYQNGQPKINEVERVSKSSRRVYHGVKDLKYVRNGYGRLILSTPKGILTDKEARKELVGGEALFKIW